MVNSGEYDGMDAKACKSKITADLESKGWGKGAINYKLRDWIFSVRVTGASLFLWFGFLRKITIKPWELRV